MEAKEIKVRAVLDAWLKYQVVRYKDGELEWTRKTAKTLPPEQRYIAPRQSAEKFVDEEED